MCVDCHGAPLGADGGRQHRGVVEGWPVAGGADLVFPEILPFILAPLGATVAWMAWRGQAVAPLELGKRIGKSVALAVVINPDNTYWMVLGFLA